VERGVEKKKKKKKKKEKRGRQTVSVAPRESASEVAEAPCAAGCRVQLA
jgi:hypothetical protein